MPTIQFKIAAGLGLKDGPVRLDAERLLAVGSSPLYDAVSVTGAHHLEDGMTVEVFNHGAAA